MSFVTSAFSVVTGALGGIWGYVAAFGVGAVLVGGGAAYATHHWDANKLQAVELADANSVLKAEQVAAASQKAQDGVSLAAAVSEANAQNHVTTVIQTVTKEIPRYVTIHQDATVCVPYGLVRLLDATVDQTDPANFKLATGQSDDTCSPVKASALADNVIANYGAALGNAEQLTALQAWVIANHAAQQVAP
jgi:hypothetical protein